MAIRSRYADQQDIHISPNWKGGHPKTTTSQAMESPLSVLPPHFFLFDRGSETNTQQDSKSHFSAFYHLSFTQSSSGFGNNILKLST